MDTIRWGIVGCGDVTEVKSGPAFRKAAGSALTAVMRRNGALAEDYAVRHGVGKWYDDAERLMYDPEVDAVYIATPPAFHKEYTLLAARAGKPVYVEKPMACTYAECLDMIEACERAGVPLFVAYYRRELPLFKAVKALLDDGAIGEARYVRTLLTQPRSIGLTKDGELPWRVQPQLAGGGLFADLASHTFDILDFLLGPIASAEGIAVNQAGLYPAEDTVAGSYRFESGVVGSGMWCFDAFESTDANELVGTEGKLVFPTFGNDLVIHKRGETPTRLEFERPQHVQQPFIQTMVDELRGGTPAVSTGRSAARTNRVMDALLKSYYEERTPGFE
ncbi:oxidoreductase [Paenibacillus darwinianus]|uniref:Oxidoreductase n=1 Tax=Paenibacillus darwinianus TaxID=1380763 RepID=A0A9W5S215_9BACL|nr:Gfo/Idh/MocA family oxidoreductase [Paenibacillus darwinianus]EXX89158.1 oxidoreductase [Paenibacillus darwinianus]EXX89518.1 oxidoreductase [Paenibacillus darwinianus]EXX89709.1 oxidoreductase [Paenibacillus darwinianus]